MDGSEELSAIATIEKTVGNASRGAYMGINSLAAAATLYVPLAQRKAPTASGPANTEIMVQNISGIDIIVSIQMIGAPGIYGNYTKDQFISAPLCLY